MMVSGTNSTNPGQILCASAMIYLVLECKYLLDCGGVDNASNNLDIPIWFGHLRAEKYTQTNLSICYVSNLCFIGHRIPQTQNRIAQMRKRVLPAYLAARYLLYMNNY